VESQTFISLFEFLAGVMGAGAFVRYRGNTPVGALAPAYFEAVTMGTLRAMPGVENVDPAQFQAAIRETVQGDVFRGFTGPGANSKEKLESRINTIHVAIAALL